MVCGAGTHGLPQTCRRTTTGTATTLTKNWPPTGFRQLLVHPAPPRLPVSSADRGAHEDEVLDPVHLLLVLRHEGEDIRQLFYYQRHRSIERRHDRRTVDKLLHGTPLDPPAVQTRRADGLAGSPWRQAHHPRPSDSTRCLPPGEEDASGSSAQSSTRNLPPRPWPSSVSVWLSGGVVTWPGPQRSTAARVATTSAVVAASDAEQRSSWAAS